MRPNKPSVRKKISRSNEGSMPFALIAVTLLLTGSAFGVIYASIERAEESTENIESELNSIDEMIYETRSMIISGLGSIICDISTAETGGTLLDRIEDFDKMSDAYFAGSFPYRNRGITVTIIDRDLNIDVQSMKLSSDDVLTDASVASYLVASGTVTAEFSGSAGMSVKTLNISANGTSGLPFIVDSATKFELKSDSDASLLTQLISYQLTALAQSRIVNGYGLRSYYGEKGTVSIITESDVEEAFRNALTVIETVCFRCNGEDREDIVNCVHIDPAEMMIQQDGYYIIDMSSIVSQAMLAVIDLLVVRWIDLLSMDKIIEIVDSILDVGKEFINNVLTFIFKNNDSEQNRNSAYVYLREMMEAEGYDAGYYRYLMSGYDITVEIEDGELELNGDTVGYSGGTYSVDCPVVDVFEWGGWENFKVNYEKNRNTVEEFLRSTITSICTGIADDYDVYRIPVDEFDETSFSDSFTKAVMDCIIQSLSGFSERMSDRTREDSIGDMFYGSLYQAMVSNRAEIFKEDSYGDMIVERLYPLITDNIEEDKTLARLAYENEAKKRIEETVDIDALTEAYRICVGDVLSSYRDTLTNTSKKSSNVLTEMVASAGKMVLGLEEVRTAVSAAAMLMIDEIGQYVKANCDYGLVSVDGKNSFMLYDMDKNLYEEFTDICDDYTLNISVMDPSQNRDKCCHRVGFNEVSLTAYTSVFTVSLDAEVRYTAHTMSSVDMALGRYDSSFSDSFVLSTKFDIACVSAWSLFGVEYPADTNLANEIVRLIFETLEPLFGKAVELYNSVKVIFNSINDAIVEFRSYVTDFIELIYDAIMSCVEGLTDFLMSTFAKTLVDIIRNAFGNVSGFDIGPAYQSITFNLYGLKLTILLNLAKWEQTTKTVAKVTLEGKIGDTDFSAFIDVKESKKKETLIKFGGGVSGEDWALNLAIDPLMKFGSKTVSVNGIIKDVEFDVAVPERLLYNQVGVAVSDVSLVADRLSKIPLPIPGYEASFDMGLDLKYNLPVGTGLMINEFESNPSGEDAGNEWVELYNGTAKAINLSGYMLVPESNESKAMVITGTTIEPMEKLIFTFEKQSLNNSRSGKYNGESISLYSPEGEKIDSTPWKKDTYNDDKTWQRECDGSSTWVFQKGTPEESNGDKIHVNAIAKTFFVDTFIKAVDLAFAKKGNHLTSVDDVEEFLQYLLKYYIDEIIKKIVKMIISASVYIYIEITDYAETQHVGLRLGFEMGQEFVEESIYWLLKQIGYLSDLIKEPTYTDYSKIVCSNIYFTTTAYGSISTPKILSSLESEEMQVGYSVGANISSFCRLFGGDEGRWKAYCGIVAEGLDPRLLPTGLKSNQEKECDLWLIKVTFREKEE